MCAGAVWYDLEGVIQHRGGSDSGHYKSFIRSQDNKWICFNDREVTQGVKEENVLNGDALIMRYARR